MINQFEGQVFYKSSFDETYGVLVREVDVVPTFSKGYGSTSGGLVPKLALKIAKASLDQLPSLEYRAWRREHEDTKDPTEAAMNRWCSKFPYRAEAFSPVPETVDVCITDHCGFGCTYCYMNSTAQAKHAPADLAVRIIEAFDSPPYQMALGGGEPTTHPNLPHILHAIRERGVVPNYTTAGHVFRQDVIAATNQYCGGVSITYHAFKGLPWFSDAYMRLRRALRVPMNIHLIADASLGETLEDMLKLAETAGTLSIILLAYYPETGRGDYTRVMPKKLFHEQLPGLLKKVLDKGHKIAFSEGLLPYFLSRPEIGVDTQFAAASEGLFSAYVDSKGRMSGSSFDPPGDTDRDSTSAFSHQKTLQAQWSAGVRHRSYGDARCNKCAFRTQCAQPHRTHFYQCAFGPVTKSPLQKLKLDEMRDAIPGYASGEFDSYALRQHLTTKLGRKPLRAEVTAAEAQAADAYGKFLTALNSMEGK